MEKIINGATGGKCPFGHGAVRESAGGGTVNRDWWPGQKHLKS